MTAVSKTIQVMIGHWTFHGVARWQLAGVPSTVEGSTMNGIPEMSATSDKP